MIFSWLQSFTPVLLKTSVGLSHWCSSLLIDPKRRKITSDWISTECFRLTFRPQVALLWVNEIDYGSNV
jgi:hypothetical protein